MITPDVNLWKTPDSYDRDFEPLPARPGVYALVHFNYKNGWKRICYIGKSKNLKERVPRNHADYRACVEKYGYTQRRFIECENPDALERRLIAAFRPEFNFMMYEHQ